MNPFAAVISSYAVLVSNLTLVAMRLVVHILCLHPILQYHAIGIATASAQSLNMSKIGTATLNNMEIFDDELDNKWYALLGLSYVPRSKIVFLLPFRLRARKNKLRTLQKLG